MKKRAIKIQTEVKVKDLVGTQQTKGNGGGEKEEKEDEAVIASNYSGLD